MPPGSNPLKPVIGAVPNAAPRPNTGSVPPRKKWRFSMRFWRQSKYFGVSECSNAWFIGLFERLTELSKIELEDFLSDKNSQAAFRFHAIDWKAKSIPISKSDIDGLAEYDTPEYEFVQFHISKAMGRVVGFFDEENTFQIVLCDPMHNIQPSKIFNYRVRATHVAECELTRMALRYQNTIHQRSDLTQAQKDEILAAIRAHNLTSFGAAILVTISEQQLASAYELIASGAVNDLGDLMQLAIDDVHSLV